MNLISVFYEADFNGSIRLIARADDWPAANVDGTREQLGEGSFGRMFRRETILTRRGYILRLYGDVWYKVQAPSRTVMLLWNMTPMGCAGIMGMTGQKK